MNTASMWPRTGWSFFTNHGHVLFSLARNPRCTLREVADMVGITERAVQRIVSDMVDAGVLTRQREGRRNRYIIDLKAQLRHPIEGHCRVGDLLGIVVDAGTGTPRRA